jgi:hypothetical protein
MENVNNQEHVDLPFFNFVALKKGAHNCEIGNKQYCIPCGNPPINSSMVFSKLIENTLNDKSRKPGLLANCLNTNIRHSEKYAIHHNQTFCCRIRKGK